MGRLAAALFRLRHPLKKRFHCPLCGYRGPFRDQAAGTGLRRHARCPRCGALERHRLQYLVIDGLLRERDAARMRVLHMAPEPFLAACLRARAGSYTSADPVMGGVDHAADLRALPFADGSFDLVFASHVLEHIAEDEKALAEIRRVLSADGLAVLPVPVVAETTIEYPAPNPHESGHVRAPGLDYFDRYLRFFPRVERVSSDRFPDCHQLYIYEDRSCWPTPGCPLLRPMSGERHVDIVPVCYVRADP